MLGLRESLQTTVDVTESAATEVPKAGPVNNFMHSLFNQVDFFNQKPVSPATNAFVYECTLKLY